MVFWALAAILTAVVTIALLAPMARSSRASAASGAAAHDLEVYRDQLAEIERDEAAGLIDKTEADYARTEVSRRMLRAAKAEGSGKSRSKLGSTAALRIAVLLFVPAVALATYLASGAPDLPHQPLASRMAEPATPTALSGNAPPEVAELIARAEQHLANNPDDGRGWDVLAPIYARVGRLEDSRTAYANAIRLLGASPARQSGFGETLVALAGGVVTEEARLAFESAREMEPEDPKAAFFLALALAQEGRADRARDAFQTIAERSASCRICSARGRAW
jgi:cytochrome c-type biogenesis protein CcmH